MGDATSNYGFIWYMLAYLSCLHAIIQIWGKPFIYGATKAIMVELTEQDIVVDSVKGFFDVYENSTGE